MYGQLEDLEIDWTKTAIFQVDERVAPAGSDERNLTHLIAALSIGAQGSLRPMPVTDDDLDGAADRYAELPEALDLVHLGLGPDGHTASLVPGDPVLEVDDRRVALTAGEYQGIRRMTLTYPELLGPAASSGSSPAPRSATPLAKLLARDPSIPAGRVEAEATRSCSPTAPPRLTPRSPRTRRGGAARAAARRPRCAQRCRVPEGVVGHRRLLETACGGHVGSVDGSVGFDVGAQGRSLGEVRPRVNAARAGHQVDGRPGAMLERFELGSCGLLERPLRLRYSGRALTASPQRRLRDQLAPCDPARFQNAA